MDCEYWCGFSAFSDTVGESPGGVPGAFADLSAQVAGQYGCPVCRALGCHKRFANSIQERPACAPRCHGEVCCGIGNRTKSDTHEAAGAGRAAGRGTWSRSPAPRAKKRAAAPPAPGGRWRRPTPPPPPRRRASGPPRWRSAALSCWRSTATSGCPGRARRPAPDSATPAASAPAGGSSGLAAPTSGARSRTAPPASRPPTPGGRRRSPPRRPGRR